MGDPLNTPDFLEAALRQSRVAIPDAGFTARLERRVQAHRRRMRIARVLPAIMAILGISLAAALTNYSGVNLGKHLPDFSNVLSALARTLGPASELAHRLGLDPWMLLTGAVVLAFALASNRREPRLALQL
jgi:hypothetical protein